MKTLTGVIALMLALLVGVSNVAVAAEKATAPAAKTDHLYLKMTGKVTRVNEKANTFTVMAKDKPFTFGSKSLRVRPMVGEIVDVTYTGNPGGPMEATNLNSSRSNID